jgi:serine/threonine protein kinase/WD40 repeat protein
MVLDEKAIFVAALELPDATEREAYLQEACAGHPELLGHLRELLSAHEESQGPLDRRPPMLGVTVDGPAGNDCPGMVIGPYKLLEQIGEGGFGVVFMAEQTQPVRRKVALKVLKPGMDTRQVVARFEAERQALALMDHPNIARVLDGGATTSGRPYFAMELVRGIPITEFCDQNHMPVRERLELFVSVCQAVQHAHQKGIIHRDLKPSNIMVTMHDDRPVAKVIDFGIAKATGQQLTDKTLFTNFAQMIGTPLYMSPEQAQMSGLDVDTRSDIYSLGVLLYELMTGTTPFDRQRLSTAAFEEIRRIIREEEPPRPSTRFTTPGQDSASVSANRKSDAKQLSQAFRGELDWIVMKALEKDRNRRYETAGAFAADVRRHLNGEQVLACPPTLSYRLRKTVRRHRGPVLAVSLVVLALVGGIVGTTWGLIRATEAQSDAVREAVAKEQALEDARQQLFRALFTRAQALRKSGEMGQRFGSLAALKEAVGIAQSLGVLEEHTLELRTETVACLALADLRVVEEWDAPASLHSGRQYRAAFDAGLERYSCADEEGNVRIFRVADRQEIARLPGLRAKVRDVEQQFSADGLFLATAYWFAGPQPAQFVLWELRDTGPVRRLGPAEHTAFYAFSADGRWLAVGQPDGSIALHDLASGDQRRLGPDHRATIMAFRPDGQQLAFARHPANTDVQILDLKRNQVVRSLGHPDDVRRLAWSADGRLLAAGCDDRNVHVWDTQTWKPQALLEGHQKAVWGVAFSPTGDLLASSAMDGTTRLWDPVSGRPLLTAPGEPVQFSRDGQRLAFRRGSRLGVWEMADGHECSVLHHGRVGNRGPWLNYKGPEMLNFSADSRLLASAAADGVRLWDVASRQEAAFLNVGHNEAALFHPEGERLYTFGRTGLRCWPLRPDDPGSLRVGPAEMVVTPDGGGWFRGGSSGDGRLIAAADHPDDRRDRLFVFPTERPAARTLLGDDCKLTRIAVSPDGRWVAGALIEPALGIKVWDARTGRLAWSSVGDRGYVTFSPDGAWLMAAGLKDCAVWKVGTWEPGPLLPHDGDTWGGACAFRPDGRVLAVACSLPVAYSLQCVRLLDFATRQVIATLAAPDLPCIENWLCFSPDGGLLAVATEAHTIQLWDLGAIGARLRDMGLGCKLLPDSPPGPSGGAPPRVRVYQEVLEAEHLPVVDSNAAWGTYAQDTRRWGRHWSNDKQLHCGTLKGQFVELQVDVPETGRYRLAVCLSRSWNFGRSQVSLDGRKIGGTFDGFHGTGGTTEKVEYGTFELREGSHRLRFTAVDKHPQSEDYFIGIDYVQLTPTKD